MEDSARLAAIRKMARSEPEQGSRPVSRAWMAAFQRMTASGCPVVMEEPAVMMRRKAGSCRKWPWRMISSTAAASAHIPSAASRSRQASRSAGRVAAFTAAPPPRPGPGCRRGPGPALIEG